MKVANQVKPDEKLAENLATTMRTVSELREVITELAAKLDRALLETPVEIRLPIVLAGLPAADPPSSTRLWVAGGLWIASELLPKGGKRAKEALRMVAGHLAIRWGVQWLKSL